MKEDELSKEQRADLVNYSDRTHEYGGTAGVCRL